MRPNSAPPCSIPKCASERDPPKIPVTVVPSGGRIDLGPFNVEFIPVAHSIPESHALAIHTSAGTVLHTGDWKIDPTPIIGLPTDERRLRELGDAGVLALVGNSTTPCGKGARRPRPKSQGPSPNW